MINVLSKEAHTFGAELVAYLEDNDYCSFDGGEQEDRQDLVMSWACRVQELINGGTSESKADPKPKTRHAEVVLSKGSSPWDGNPNPAFNIEYNTTYTHPDAGLFVFTLDNEPVLAVDPKRISYIKYKKV
jgi:hypothetical protein